MICKRPPIKTAYPLTISAKAGSAHPVSTNMSMAVVIPKAKRPRGAGFPRDMIALYDF